MIYNDGYVRGDYFINFGIEGVDFYCWVFDYCGEKFGRE